MVISIFLVFLSTALFSSAAIYGADDRREITEFPWLGKVGRSVAVIVPKDFLLENPDGSYRMEDVETLGETTNLCKEERFLDQPSIGNCTAFLVGEKTVVTAGHCYLNVGVVSNSNKGWCEAFSFLFGYDWSKNNNKLDLAAIPKNRVYHCKKTVRAEHIDVPMVPGVGSINGNDFAVIELDRKASNLTPLRLATARPKKGDWVYTLGHPFGLPLKHSGYSRTLNDDLPMFFSVNLDSQGGNSGGPVFNIYNEVVGLLSSGHQIDDTRLAGKSCDNFNRCDDKAKSCYENSKWQHSNHIFDIQKVIPWL